MADTDYEKNLPEITRRMKILRFAICGNSQAEFARRIGISSNRWNNIERGYPLSMKVAYMLTVRIEGLSMGWITHGRTGDLTISMMRQLDEAERSLGGPRRRGIAK